MDGGSWFSPFLSFFQKDKDEKKQTLQPEANYICDRCEGYIFSFEQRTCCLTCSEELADEWKNNGYPLKKGPNVFSYDLCGKCWEREAEENHKGHKVYRWFFFLDFFFGLFFFEKKQNAHFFTFFSHNSRYDVDPSPEKSQKKPRQTSATTLHHSLLFYGSQFITNRTQKKVFFVDIHQQARALQSFFLSPSPPSPLISPSPSQPLYGLNLQRDEKIIIFSRNSIEWVVVDVACFFSGCASVPITHNLSPSTAVEVMEMVSQRKRKGEDDRRGGVVVVEWELVPIVEQYLEKVYSPSSSLLPPKAILLLPPPPASPPPTASPSAPWPYPLSPLIPLSTPLSTFSRTTWLPLRPSSSPTELSTIIFTSGSTGRPKGVMITEEMLLSELGGGVGGGLFSGELVDFWSFD